MDLSALAQGLHHYFEKLCDILPISFVSGMSCEAASILYLVAD